VGRRSRKPPSARGTRRGGTGRPSALRVAAALVLLGAGVALVIVFGRRTPRPAPEAVPDPAEVVRAVASRLGCASERITVERVSDREGALSSVTVHAPAGFKVQRFELELEAAVHNLAGRLARQPLTEGGGYGLARLEGVVAGQRVRVVVLGEEPPVTPKGVRPPQARPRLAIVLDDAGASRGVVEEIAPLPREVAVAVLPNAAHSAEVARALAAQGREILLHMPMQPVGGPGPGPGDGAIQVGLTRDEIGARVARALAVVAEARGVNNHMGSLATTDMPTMRAVMAALANRKLFFLDSRTSTATVAEQAARDAGVPTLRRDVFLDVVSEPDAVRRALQQAVARARGNGSAVAIGHVHPITIEVLMQELPALAHEVKLVPPSQLAD